MLFSVNFESAYISMKQSYGFKGILPNTFFRLFRLKALPMPVEALPKALSILKLNGTFIESSKMVW